LLMVAVTEYARERIEQGRNKLVPTEEELNPNTKFINNAFIAQLETNKELLEFIDNQKRTWNHNIEFVKELYETIIDSDIYKDYMSTTEKNYTKDRELCRKLYKSFVFHNDSLDEVLEDQSLYWNDDKEIVDTFVFKTIKRFDEDKGANQKLLPAFKDE